MGTPALRRTLSFVVTAGLVTGGVATMAPTAAFAATVGVSPSSSLNNQHRELTFTGGTWLPTATSVTLVRHADTSDTISGTVTTPAGPPVSSLKADFDLTAAAPAKYDVQISPGTGAPMDTCTNCFTVSSKTPTVTAFSPNTSGTGVNNQVVTITGTEFARGATVAAYLPGSPTPDGNISFDASTLDVASPTSLSIEMDVAGAAALGPRTIRVTNTDGQFGNCAGCLVIAGGPTITHKSQDSVGQGANVDVTFDGTKFKDGATVAFSAALPTINGVTADNVRVTADGMHLTTTVHVPSSEPNADTAPTFTSTRTVKITNPGGAFAQTTMTVTTKPTASSLAETTDDGKTNNNNDLGQGATRNFTVTGSNIQAGATLSAGSDVAVTNVVRVNATTIKGDFAASNTATTGDRDVSVVNPDGGTGVCTGCLAVNPAPTVTSTAPNTVSAGGSGTMTVNGSNFVTGATVTFGNDDVHATGATVVAMNGNSLTVPYSVDSPATQGSGSVTVTNTDLGAGTCASCLFVQGLGAITVDESPVANNNGTSQAFTIHGSGFDLAGAGPTVVLTADPAVTGQGPIPVDINLGTSTTSLLHGTANIQTAAPVTYDLDVTNPGSNADAGRCDKCVTINGAQPTLTSMSAHAIAAGQTRTFTLTGDDFSFGMTVQTGLPKVTAGTVTVNSPSSATVTLSAASDATIANHVKILSIKTADNQSNLATENQDLNVVAPPTLSMAWPSELELGAPIADGAFDAFVSNTGGSTFNGRIDFTISGVSGLDDSDLTFEYDTTGSGDWAPVSLTGNPDESISGYIPPQGGTALAASSSQTTHLRIKVGASAPTGDLTIDSSYGDVASNSRIDTVATDSDTVALGTVPSKPLNVIAQAGNKRALVTWSAPLSNGNSDITGYTVTASPGGAETSVGASENSVTIPGLTNGTAYTFTVVATNALGDSPNGGPSAAVTPHTPKVTVDLPASMNAGGGPAELALTVDNDTITGYPKARIGFTISGMPGLSASRVELVNTTGGGHAAVDLSGSGGTVHGRLPNNGTFAMTEDSTRTFPFDFSVDGAAPSGSISVKATFVDASTAGSPKNLSSDTDSIAVAGKSARFVRISPKEFVDSRTGKGVAQGKHNGATRITVPNAVPKNARAVWLDVHVDASTKSGHLQVFPTGATATNTALSYIKGDPQSELTVTRMGSNRHVTLKLSKGAAHLAVDLLGYEVDKATKPSKRFTALMPVRVGDTRPAANSAHRIATVTVPSSVPANSTVLIDVSAVNVNANGTMKVYPAAASAPATSAIDFVSGEPDTTAYVVKLSGRKMKIDIDGRADALVDLLGYYSGGKAWDGRFDPVGPLSLGGVASSGTSTLTLPGAVPDNATSVLMTVNAKGASAAGRLRAWATGTNEPTSTQLSWAKGRSAAALVVARVGAGGKVTFRVKGGGPTVSVEIIGYTTG